MDRTMNLFQQESATRRAWENWKAERKANERRWMLAKDLEWIISTTTTEEELISAVEDRIYKARNR